VIWLGILIGIALNFALPSAWHGRVRERVGEAWEQMVGKRRAPTPPPAGDAGAIAGVVVESEKSDFSLQLEPNREISPKRDKRPMQLYSFVGAFDSMRLWIILAVAVAVLGGLYFFARHFEAVGVSKERARWEHRVEVLTAQSAKAAEEEARTYQRRITRLNSALARAQQSLEDIPDEAPAVDFLVAWARADARLCDGCAR
jgi:hypothetical protein